jgi:prophage antirepressor-like protein
MTALLLMETDGGPQQVRIFSTRGAYLMGMFAKTDRGKRFRRWVLDVLEGKIDIAARQQSGRSKAERAERQSRVNEWKAATNALAEIRRTWGCRTAARNATGIFANLGLVIDLTGSDTLAQGELPFAEAAEMGH